MNNLKHSGACKQGANYNR